jgi:uncharacterized protein (DUF1810 family)
MTDGGGDLERFVVAQEADGAYERALAELRSGRKASHWMWFIFPQLAGLGRSSTARYYALVSTAEATAYLDHSVLGPRLLACTELVAQAPPGARRIFGEIDAMKLRSSMTLFLRARPAEPLFQAVLDRHFGGQPDPATEVLL